MCGGLSVVAGLRAVGCAAPVILITAFADADLLEQSFAIGDSVVMSKPFDLEEFLLVAAALGRKPDDDDDLEPDTMID